MDLIYHFVLPEIWAEFENKDYYEAESLTTEGFIHCSFENQLEGVLNRYFVGIKRVLILHLDTGRLTSELIVEPSINGELYPHIYGKINRRAVVKIEDKVLV